MASPKVISDLCGRGTFMRLKAGFFLAFVIAIEPCALAQSFSSGSTGADGALNCSGSSATVQLPASGILNYTTVNIANGCTLSFLPNVTNTPVTMLATGAVTIAGSLSLNGAVPAPGPGGVLRGSTRTEWRGPRWRSYCHPRREWNVGWPPRPRSDNWRFRRCWVWL